MIIVGEDTINNLTEWQRDLLFAWRSRANCYNCFNQRKYEWVGLYENAPGYFWKAEAMEHSESEYYWNGKDSPLTLIAEQAETIKAKRIKQIVKTIRGIRDAKTQQITMWDFNREDEVMNFFNQTSCGLYCGK